jgi:hypothetical protein
LFLVSSVFRGDISTVDPNGKVTVVIPPILAGYATLGVKTDSDGNIYVAISDPTKFTSAGIAAGGLSYVAKYNKEYKQVYITQLPVRTSNFANDLKVLATGEVLVTDSASNTVFKLSAVGGVCTTLVVVTGAVIIDGIECMDDYLLVTDFVSGKLYRISVVGNATVNVVAGVNAPMDGIAFDGQTLLGVNATHYQSITSSDKFVSAVVKAWQLPDPTSYGTSIVPYGKNMAAVSNVYGFNSSRTIYTIDLVSTGPKYSSAMNYPVDFFLWGVTVLAAMV